MKLRAFASIGAAAMMFASVATGYAVEAPRASDQATVDIVVTSAGVLSVTVTETETFDDIAYSFDDQKVEGDLTVQVTDQRGTAAGWTFNLRGSDFTGSRSGPGDSFPISGLSLVHTSTTPLAGNPSTKGIAGYDIPSVNATGNQIVSASTGFGNGQYDVLFDGTLVVPGDTLVDSYTATIVVEVPSAPN